MAARLDLAFLYQTRSILRLAKDISIPTRRFSSNRKAGDVSAWDDHETPSPEDGSLLKARTIETSPKGSGLKKKSTTKENAEPTTISSTITASERRAFETILRFAPQDNYLDNISRQSYHRDYVDTDIDNILKIFNSSLREIEAEQKLKEDKIRKKGIFEGVVDPDGPESPTEEPVSTSPVTGSIFNPFSRDERKETESSLFSTFLEESQLNGVGAKEASTIGRPTETGSEPWPTQSDPSIALPSAPATESDAVQVTDPVDADDELGPFLAETANPSAQSSRMTAKIQSAVRSKLQSISDSLKAAASSHTVKGDIAMWEVVESQIFSMAQHFQTKTPHVLEQEATSRLFGGISQFTFSREMSDKPRQMIEEAERQARLAPTSPSATTSSSTSTTGNEIRTATTTSPPPLPTQDLLTLHTTYPAALLLALRLYITHFPSSPHPFLLLPRIRSLGTTSYVLGASPAFYNSLITLTWMVKSSLREVDALLAEMDRGGVEMDEGTYATVVGIQRERNADMKPPRQGRWAGGFGGRVATTATGRSAGWWKMQEQLLFLPKVFDWLDVIAGRVTARARLRGT